MKQFPPTLRHGSGVEMTLDSTRLLLVFRNPPSRDNLVATLKRMNLVLEGSDPTHERRDLPWSEVVNHTDTRLWVRTVSGEPISEETFQLLERVLGDDLEAASAVYHVPGVAGRGGLVSPLANVVVVKADPRQGKAVDALGRQGLREVPEKSRYLGDYRYFLVAQARDRNAYQLRAALAGAGMDVRFENMPMLVPLTGAAAPAIPIPAAPATDPMFPQQWDMTQIDAPDAWDLADGTGVIIGVLDSGVDQSHPDLMLAAPGINLGTMTAPGAPNGAPNAKPHGTCCAGIATAVRDNSEGVAGVAGRAAVLPIAFQNWTDVECAAGINWAGANGARVLSMSFGVYAPGDGLGPTGWDFTLIDPAIAQAVNVIGMVLCAATGNENTGTVNRYPARHPLVIACGGSDRTDNRKRPGSPDGEQWGANFGPGISVVAPAIQCPTTDIQDTGGYNANHGGPIMIAGVNYPSSGDAAGNYFLEFNGTSSATPHVAGLAGLLGGAYPTLTPLQIRSIIERTAAKVGAAPYADVSGFANGSRTPQLGYGRIDTFRAVDFADVMIRDWSGDTGIEPSAPPAGDFWDFSDLVVRPTDDGVFLPTAVNLAHTVTRNQTNWIYARVTNLGPREARDVTVSLRITPYVGLQFFYPADWTAVDANHVSPTAVTNTFATVPVGGSVIAKFTVTAAQVDQLWGWISGMGWHPCLLAQVTADNDYAFASAAGGGNLVTVHNNLAQRNLTVIPVTAASLVTFPFVAGHLADREETMTLVVDRSLLPRATRVRLSLADAGRAFPRLERPAEPAAEGEECADDLVFLDRTRVRTRLGCCHGILVLERGTRFTCGAHAQALEVDRVAGGRVVLQGRERFVEVEDERAEVTLRKQPGQVYPLAVELAVPERTNAGESLTLRVSQRNGSGRTVGGATGVWIVA